MKPAKLVYIMLMATALALVVLWQGVLIRRAGYRVQDLREEADEQAAQKAIYRAHLSKLKNPGRVLTLLSCLRFELREPPVAARREVLAQQPDRQTSVDNVLASDTPLDTP